MGRGHHVCCDRRWLGVHGSGHGFVFAPNRRLVGGRQPGDVAGDRCAAHVLPARKPSGPLLHHSNRSCQYASGDYRRLLDRHEIKCSMSRRGNCWDNTPMERFMNSYKHEWMNHQQHATVESAQQNTFKYIEFFSNRRRRHQTLGYVSPAEYERIHRSQEAAYITTSPVSTIRGPPHGTMPSPTGRSTQRTTTLIAASRLSTMEAHSRVHLSGHTAPRHTPPCQPPTSATSLLAISLP